jgi:hypothetical protein
VSYFSMCSSSDHQSVQAPAQRTAMPNGTFCRGGANLVSFVESGLQY